MFIRESIKTVKGKKYIQHHLIESVRTPVGPRQRFILNLGQIDLPKEQWKELANAIENRLHNQEYLFELDHKIKALSKYYSDMIIRSGFNKKHEDKQLTENLPDYETVDINSICVTHTRTIGIEHIMSEQFKEYRFDNILKLNGLDENQIRNAKILITGRLAHPASERETVRWVNENSSIQEFFGSEQRIYDNALHRTAVMLWEHRQSIENKLSQEARKKFSLKETIVLYDLTNTYFEGTKKNSQIAKHGKSKERRNDRPLVTLGLCVDDDGFPKHSRIFEGNISEPETLKYFLEQLITHRNEFDFPKTIVIDAGIASEENLEMIKIQNFNYVAISRKKTYEENFWETGIEKTIFLNNNIKELKVKLVRTDKESFLLCRSDDKQIKEQAIFDKKYKQFENQLEQIKSGLKKKGTRKTYEFIQQRIGRLKEKYKVGHLYDIEITNENGIVTTIGYRRNGKFNEKESGIGEYVIRTNHMEWSENQISKIHRMLTTLEDGFRSMKSELGLRPNFHQNDISCQAHIFLSVLSYHFMIAIQKRLEDRGIRYRFETIRNILSTHVRVTTVFNTDKQHTVYIRTTAMPNKSQSEIYNALGIKLKPLKTVKFKMLSRLTNCSEEKTE